MPCKGKIPREKGFLLGMIFQKMGLGSFWELQVSKNNIYKEKHTSLTGTDPNDRSWSIKVTIYHILSSRPSPSRDG